MIVWHYTTAERLAGILAAGQIDPAAEGLAAEAVLNAAARARLKSIVATGIPQEVELRTREERPAVWFSKRPTWEPTATKGIIDPVTGARRTATREEMDRLGGGRVRIGVDSAGLVTWLLHRMESGITRDRARRLVTAAVEMGGNPGDWFVDYAPVPRERWLTVERWDGSRWTPVGSLQT